MTSLSLNPKFCPGFESESDPKLKMYCNWIEKEIYEIQTDAKIVIWFKREN
jgi:hypothetical protein